MYHAVQAFLSQTETNALPRLGEKRAAFMTLLSKIEALSAKQARPIAGLVVDRDRALAEVTRAALAVAGLARSYAEAAQLGDLAARMRLRPSHLKTVRLPQRVARARRVYDDVLPHAAVLAAEGLTPAMLADFKATLDVAEALLAQPRTTLVEKQEATKQLHKAFREIDRFLGAQLDPMMNVLRIDDPEAFGKYQRARSIIDRAARRKAAAGEATAVPVALKPAA